MTLEMTLAATDDVVRLRGLGGGSTLAGYTGPNGTVGAREICGNDFGIAIELVWMIQTKSSSRFHVATVHSLSISGSDLQASGPDQLNPMCLLERPVRSHLKPNASALSAVAFP